MIGNQYQNIRTERKESASKSGFSVRKLKKKISKVIHIDLVFYCLRDKHCKGFL